jgi:hypothetical protein
VISTGTQWLAIWSIGSKWVVSEVAGKAGRGCVDSSLVAALNQCTVTLIDPETRAQCLPYEQREYHELFINSLLSVCAVDSTLILGIHHMIVFKLCGVIIRRRSGYL